MKRSGTSGVKRSRDDTDDNDGVPVDKQPRLLNQLNNANAKGVLNEWRQKNGKYVKYEFSEDGPDHEKQHTIRVYIDGIQYGEGSSHRKKDAEQQAAYLALRKLGINVRHMPWCQSGTSSLVKDQKSQLNEILQKRQLRHRFELLNKEGPDHAPTFTVGLLINYETVANGTGRSKTDAEQSAACLFLSKIENGDIDLNSFTFHDPPTESSRKVFRDAKSILNDWVQSRRKNMKYKEVLKQGPDNNLSFVVKLIIDERVMASGSGKSLQKAEINAAEKAIQKILNEKGENYPNFNHPRYNALSVYDELAMITHKTFEAVTHNVIVTIDKESVVAAIILENVLTGVKTVLSLGSGNVFVDEDSLSGNGQSVIDSHAEIIARRGFQRVLYKEIETLRATLKSKHGILRQNNDGNISVADDVRFHLFISKAPCGDGSIFTLSQKMPSLDTGTRHKPVQSDKKQGLLRAKIARGEGAIPVTDLPAGRFHKMSCSDKICKWNVLGIQGALLSKIISLPMYLSSIVLGDVYDFTHLSRALCCRVESQIPQIGGSSLHVNHPDIGFSNIHKEPDLGKSKPISVNWNVADGVVEITNGRTGKISRESYLQKETCTREELSRLCKSEMFRLYKKHHIPGQCYDVLYCRQTKDSSYYELKQCSTEYQKNKEELYQHFKSKGLGAWKKQINMDSFELI